MKFMRCVKISMQEKHVVYRHFCLNDLTKMVCHSKCYLNVVKVVMCELIKLSSSDLLDIKGLQDAFKEYAMDTLDYFEDEAEFVARGLKDAYDTPYIFFDFYADVLVDDIIHNVYKCKTDFCACGLFELVDKPPFEFYMLLNTSDLADETVGSYKAARKLYALIPFKQLDEL